jgi:hypothetical protein
MDEHLIDKRVIERAIRKGKLDPKEHRRSLASLPDSSDRVARSAPEPMAHAPSMSAMSAVAPQAASAEPTPDMDDELDDEEDEDDEPEDDAPADAVL